jgi:hypothetical protein
MYMIYAAPLDQHQKQHRNTHARGSSSTWTLMFSSKKRDKEYLSVSPHKASDLLAPPAGHRMSACVIDGRRPDNNARPSMHG